MPSRKVIAVAITGVGFQGEEAHEVRRAIPQVR